MGTPGSHPQSAVEYGRDRPTTPSRLHHAQPGRPRVLHPQGNRLVAAPVRPFGGRGGRLGSLHGRRARSPAVTTVAQGSSQAPGLTGGARTDGAATVGART